jgi:hypothetical protein
MNLVFVSALYTGLLDQILLPYQPIDDEGNFSHHLHVEVLTIISHLLLPRRLPPRSLHDIEVPQSTEGCMVVLPPLTNAELREHVAAYNRQVIHTFTDYVRVQVTNLVGHDPVGAGWLHLPGATAKMPDKGELPSKCELGKRLAMLRLHTEVCSPFLAVSGGGDRFPDAEALTNDVPHGVFVDRDLIPTSAIAGGDERLSAYIIDFFKTGNKEWLYKYHGLKRTVQHETMRNVSHILRVVTEALKRRIAPDRSDPTLTHVYMAFNSTARAFHTVYTHRFAFTNASLD